MTVSDNTDSLRQRIEKKITEPLSQTGQMAFEAFVSLPNIAAWSPERLLLYEMSTVFDVGLPFALLRDNKTVTAHKQAIVKRLVNKQEIQCSRWSEVLAGALLASWSGHVSFLRETDTPTPDLEASWPDGPIVSVEVTRSEARRTQLAVSDAIGRLVGAIQAGDFNWHLVYFFADASDADDLNAVFEAVIDLDVGQMRQSEGRWTIQAIPISRRPDVVGGRVAELFAPPWWPSHKAEYVSTSTVSSSDWPVIHVRSLFPDSSYINPVMRKADSGQRRPNRPYLIALDADQLPDAHEKIKEDLEGYFSIWPHVSGVLVFDTAFITGIRRKSWRVSLHTNEHAEVPLPSQLTSLADSSRRSIDFEMAHKQ